MHAFPHGGMGGFPFGMDGMQSPMDFHGGFDPYEPVAFPFGMFPPGMPPHPFGYPTNRNGGRWFEDADERPQRRLSEGDRSDTANTTAHAHIDGNLRNVPLPCRRMSDQHSQCDHRQPCDQQSQSAQCENASQSTQCDHTKHVTVIDPKQQCTTASGTETKRKCALGKEHPTVMFKYFDLTPLKVYGRGGVVRMLMNYHQMPFSEESYQFDLTGTWPDRKQIIIASGANPSGSLPVVEVDGFQLSEHNAILRYLCCANNVRSRSIEIDALSDMILDKIVPLRDGSLKASLIGDEEVKEKWIGDRVQHYAILNSLIEKHGHPLSGLISGTHDLRSFQPSDFSIYCVIHDDSRLHGSILDQFNALCRLMKTVENEHSVRKWAIDNDYLPVPFQYEPKIVA